MKRSRFSACGLGSEALGILHISVYPNSRQLQGCLTARLQKPPDTDHQRNSPCTYTERAGGVDGDEVKAEEIKLSSWTQSAPRGGGSGAQPHNSVSFISPCGCSAAHRTHLRRVTYILAHFIGPRRSLAGTTSGWLRASCVGELWPDSREQAGCGPSPAPPGSRRPALPPTQELVPGLSRGAAGPGCLQSEPLHGVSFACAHFGGSGPRR